MQNFMCLLCISLLTAFVTAMPDNNGVLEKLKAGLQYATNYLDAAKDIADLVSKSLGHKQKAEVEEPVNNKVPHAFGPSNIASAFFRLLGLDSQKVTAIAVNSVIFLAQMISSLFGLNSPKESIGRNLEDDDVQVSWDPMKFISENKNKRVQNLVKQAQDHELPTQLMERLDGFDSACIRLLLCKTSPIIRAAQTSLINKTRYKSHRMTAWLPSRNEFETNSDQCEDKHTDCILFPES